jgi:hypothetical protein
MADFSHYVHHKASVVQNPSTYFLLLPLLLLLEWRGAAPKNARKYPWWLGNAKFLDPVPKFP